MKLQKRLELAIPETWGVAVWVGLSAAVTAVCAWALDKPEWAPFYGLLNVLAYFVKEMAKGKK